MQAGKKFLALSGSNVNTISGQTAKNFLLWLTKLDCVFCATTELLVRTEPHNLDVDASRASAQLCVRRASFLPPILERCTFSKSMSNMIEALEEADPSGAHE